MSALEMTTEEDEADAVSEIRSVIVRLEPQQSGKPRPLFVLSTLLGLLSTILAGLLIHTLYNRSSSCSMWCYQSCQIEQDCEDFNWRAKNYCFKKEDSFHGIFDFPQEPRHKITQVGKPLKISKLIENGEFDKAVQLSKVINLGEETADYVDSYAAFITVKQRYWTSQLFYWFIPAESQAEDKPLIIWLQGGPGSTSLYGLLKENGPFLVDAEEKPFTGLHLVTNKHSWHKVANMIYIDNPVGTGFSHVENNTYINFRDLPQDQVTEELILFLKQFLKLLPYYLNSSKQSLPKMYIFGESYGGTYVVDLAATIEAKGLAKSFNLGGVGIGNGWISPNHQCKHADLLFNLGLINFHAYEKLQVLEGKTSQYLEDHEYQSALLTWQEEMVEIRQLLVSVNLYDVTRSHVDLSEQNIWHFLQQPHVRRAIHVGDVHFDNGNQVMDRMSKRWKYDQLENLGKLLDSSVPILVYHGNLDLILPVSGMMRALRALEWSKSHEFHNSTQVPYYATNDQKYPDILGYSQSGGGMHFVTMRNSGHMVPMDNPAWSLQVVEDFLKLKTDKND